MLCKISSLVSYIDSTLETGKGKPGISSVVVAYIGEVSFREHGVKSWALCIHTLKIGFNPIIGHTRHQRKVGVYCQKNQQEKFM